MDAPRLFRHLDRLAPVLAAAALVYLTLAAFWPFVQEIAR